MNPSPLPDDVVPQLEAVRRRLALQDLIFVGFRAALLLSAALVIIAVIRRFLFELPPWDWLWAGGAALIAGAASLAAVAARRPTLPQAAAIVDRLGATKDRFATALAFHSHASESPFREMALRECASFVRGGRFSSLVRIRIPHAWPALLAPLAALAMLIWEAHLTFGGRDAQTAAARARAEEPARRLEELARQIAKAGPGPMTPELEKIAAEMKRSAQHLRTAPRTPEEAEQDALRQLSQLEQLAQELQGKSSEPSPSEMHELAHALEENPATQTAGHELSAGDLARAAEELEKALKDLAERGEEKTSAAVEQALQKALERLAQQKQISEAVRKLAQDAAAGGQAGQLSKEVAELLKKLQSQAGSQGTGNGQKNAQAMKNLLAALQNLKAGQGGSEGEGGDPKNSDAQGVVAVSGQNPSPAPGSQPGDPGSPTGQPGSEHDVGTTDTPFGSERHAAAETGEAHAIAGRLGDGETLRQFVPGTSDDSKSKRRYKELYEAMAPAREDAVAQENVPLGARFLIKRYFDAIRPAQ